ncbi:MAG: LysR family transcriptional regulator [Proteobacteria bacterium]|nr:LysR family transcriptional regulator [Pseudomonadota bacterium]
MQDLNDLYYFVQVVDHGGFAPAGRALGVPKSKLSRRVALLEDRLGVRLIQRSTRRFAVTPVGTTYYTHCKAMLVEAQAAQESIDQTRAEPCGIVRISCPPTLLDNLVATMLADFMSAHHRVELHVEATDRVVDLIAEGIDIALRVRRPPLADSDLLLRSLAPAEQCLVASPDLLARSKLVQGPTDLAELTSLAHGESHDEHSWDLVGPQGARATISHRPRLVSRGMIALRAAALAGIGVVQLPTMMLRAELASGRLRQVLPNWAPPPSMVHAVYASRRGQLPAVRALLDFLGEQFDDSPSGP